MKRSILYIPIIIWFYFFVYNSYADETMSCEYAWKFNQCKVANQNGSSRSIKDFVCISSSKDEEILDQIILDVEFRKIDDQVEAFLDKLKQDKEASAIDSNTVIDEIVNNLVPPTWFYNQYKSLCNGWILAKRAECTNWKVPNIAAWEWIDPVWGDTECMILVKNKLNIYSQVAYDTMKLNKADVREDRLQEWVVQELRTKYDQLIDLMVAIIWNIGRLSRGITHWTPDPK